MDAHQSTWRTEYPSTPCPGNLQTNTTENYIHGWKWKVGTFYPEGELGPPRGLLPLMAVVQENKTKVRPVLEYRVLIDYDDAYTTHGDVCPENLRNWWNKRPNVFILDFQKEYL